LRANSIGIAGKSEVGSHFHCLLCIRVAHKTFGANFEVEEGDGDGDNLGVIS
jgi:hypothetical protein